MRVHEPKPGLAVETGRIIDMSHGLMGATVIVTRSNKEYRVRILLKHGRAYFNYGDGGLGHFDQTRLKQFPEIGTWVVIYFEPNNPLLAKLWSEQPQSTGRNFGALSSANVTSPRPQGLVIRQPPRFTHLLKVSRRGLQISRSRH